MKILMESGQSHKGGEPADSSLALFCASCPQPNVNLPPGWKDIADPWPFSQSFVADGCFSQVHQLARCDDDIALMDGLLYMTESSRYAEHLATARERNDVSCVHMPGDHRYSLLMQADDLH